MSNAMYEHGRASDLRRFDDAFRSAKPEPESAVIPDGTYQVVVDGVDLGTSANTGNPKITWALRISGPQMANRVLFKTHGISDNNLHIIKQELQTCGLDLDKLSDLPRAKDRMVGVELEVTKRSRNGTANVYFVKRLSEPGAAGADDDLPF